MFSSKVIKKYLQHYAEPEVTGLKALDVFLTADHVWSDVVVIPACNEKSDLLRAPPLASGRSLMILVVNQTASASAMVTQMNKALFDAVEAQFDKVWESAQAFPGFALMLFKDTEVNRDVLLVDKFSAGFQLPPKGGVGNARKVGADLATGLIQSGRIQSQWIRCTDADVAMPETYFECSSEFDGRKDVSALIYPFKHGGAGTYGAADPTGGAQSHAAAGIAATADKVALATQMYELSLHYYVAAFRAVGSVYAFHTIGSTIAIDVSHYAKVRGFPKREAGEDFYLLNKLSKSGSVLQMQEGPLCQPIQIEARLSDRVPFGTGAAVNKMTALDDVVDDYRFYDPRAFGLLGLWLGSWSAVWESQSCELRPEVLSKYEPSALLEPGPREREMQSLLGALGMLKTEKALAHAFKQSKNLEQFSRQMNIWFDAFRSLKLLHAIRNEILPSISYSKLCSRPEYAYLLDGDSDLRACQSALKYALAKST